MLGVRSRGHRRRRLPAAPRHRLGRPAALLLIHLPDHITPYGEPIAALEKFKHDGKIRHYEVSTSPRR
ncbi:MAG: aldo/keto reductase [Spirochaetaceae bacterium]|nr:aldo/keto reductase [Spirochaetaceae bacterium]